MLARASAMLVALCLGLTPLIAPVAHAQADEKSTWPVIVNQADADDPANATALDCRQSSETRDEYDTCLADAGIVLPNGDAGPAAGEGDADTVQQAPVVPPADPQIGTTAPDQASLPAATPLSPIPIQSVAPPAPTPIPTRPSVPAATPTARPGQAAWRSYSDPACTVPLMGSPWCQWMSSRRHLLTDLVVFDQSGRPLTLRAGDDVQLGTAFLDSYGQPWVHLSAASTGGWGALYLPADIVRALDRGV